MTDSGDELHDHWDGALADERDGHRVGTDAVARDATGGVGGGTLVVTGYGAFTPGREEEHA